MIGLTLIVLFCLMPLLILTACPEGWRFWLEEQTDRVRRFQRLVEQQMAAWETREAAGEPWPTRWQRLRRLRALWHETRWR